MFVRVIALALALAACSGATTEPPKAEPPPPLPTEVIVVTPPPGWVMSTWHGGNIEVAEFTPSGQTGGGYVDLLGYSMIPVTDEVRAGGPGGLRTHELGSHGEPCRETIIREHQRSDGWFAAQFICIGRKSAPDPNTIEIEFASSRLGKASIFRVWRAWRGSASDLAAMLKARTGQTLPLKSASVVSGESLPGGADALIAGLLPVFSEDLDRKVICNLAEGPACDAFKASIASFQPILAQRNGYIAGFKARGLRRFSRQEFRADVGVTGADDGTPQVVTAIPRPDFDFNDKENLSYTLSHVASGQFADGGAFLVFDPDQRRTKVERAQIRATTVMASRRLWREGLGPEIVQVYIPNND